MADNRLDGRQPARRQELARGGEPRECSIPGPFGAPPGATGIPRSTDPLCVVFLPCGIRRRRRNLSPLTGLMGGGKCALPRASRPGLIPAAPGGADLDEVPGGVWRGGRALSRKAEALGGKMLVPPVEIPTGRFAW